MFMGCAARKCYRDVGFDYPRVSASELPAYISPSRPTRTADQLSVFEVCNHSIGRFRRTVVVGEAFVGQPQCVCDQRPQARESLLLLLHRNVMSTMKNACFDAAHRQRQRNQDHVDDHQKTGALSLMDQFDFGGMGENSLRNKRSPLRDHLVPALLRDSCGFIRTVAARTGPKFSGNNISIDERKPGNGTQYPLVERGFPRSVRSSQQMKQRHQRPVRFGLPPPRFRTTTAPSASSSTTSRPCSTSKRSRRRPERTSSIRSAQFARTMACSWVLRAS